jgi:hypothetical protein
MVIYGIGDEESDFRVHVGVLAHRIFIFRTSAARDAIQQHTYRLVPTVSRDRETTAWGYCVPPGDIDGLVEWDTRLMSELEWWKKFHVWDKEGVKGKKAQNLIVSLLTKLSGEKPIIVTNKAEQISGNDIWFRGKRIQIKCDWRASSTRDEKAGTTGNLYVQTHETNVSKQF